MDSAPPEMCTVLMWLHAAGCGLVSCGSMPCGSIADSVAHQLPALVKAPIGADASECPSNARDLSWGMRPSKQGEVTALTAARKAAAAEKTKAVRRTAQVELDLRELQQRITSSGNA